MHFGATSGDVVSSYGGRLGIKKTAAGATTYRLSICNTSSGTVTFTEFAQDLNIGTTYFVVVKYDRSTSPTTASLWVNPSAFGGTEPTGSVSNASGTATFSYFASICLRNNINTPKANIDEIRVGTTWADVTPAGVTTKTVNLSVELEGLYNGAGTMRAAADQNGPHWGASVADHLTVEFHDGGTGALVYTANDVALSTTGSATFTVPGADNGNYWITVKHRNSIATASAAPVSFTGSVINYAFDAPAKAYGSNLLETADHYYVIYGGDVTQDGSVDSADYTGVDNDVMNFAAGYLSTDVNGDGSIDTGDYTIIDNNNLAFVGAAIPY
jgi:hypothetical protein